MPSGLSGTGSTTLSSPGSLLIHITAKPTNRGVGHANPSNWFGLGVFRLGNANGWLPTFHLDADDQLVPAPSGMTRLGYSLVAGVTIDVTELSPSLPAAPVVPVPDLLTPASVQAVGVQLSANSSSVNSTTAWGSANRSMIVPFQLTDVFVCTTAFVLNGGTLNGNWDVGVYSDAMTLLGHTGSQSQAGASTFQTAALSLTLAPGRYWMAFSASSATAVYQAWLTGSASRARVMGIRQADSNFPLASSPTLVGTPTHSTLAMFGISQISP